MRLEDEINGLPGELPAEEEQQLLKQGTQEARDRLLHHTLRSATRYATVLVRGRLPLGEIFSAAAHALLEAIRHYKPDHRAARLLTYSKAYICRELAKTWRDRGPIDYRRNPPDKNMIVPLDLCDTLEAEEESGPDFDRIHLNERWAMVEPHLKRLSETERRVLILLYDAKLPGPEIGRMLGFTRANVLEAKRRALKKIRGALYRKGQLYEDSRS